MRQFFYATQHAEPKFFVSVEIEMICCVYCHFSVWENAQSNLSTQCDDTEARQQQHNYCVFLPFFKRALNISPHSAFCVSNNYEWQLLSNAAVCVCVPVMRYNQTSNRLTFRCGSYNRGAHRQRLVLASELQFNFVYVSNGENAEMILYSFILIEQDFIAAKSMRYFFLCGNFVCGHFLKFAKRAKNCN